MKRIKSIALIILIGFLPLSLLTGQDKKDEKKVKIIVADKTGTRVITDTVFSGDLKNDTLILKGGNVVYISDKPSGDKKDKEIWIIARADKDGDKSSENFVFISDGKAISKIDEKDIDVLVDDKINWNDTEQVKYIIAKDGVTVSVEGKDEEKVKDIAREIEGIIGVRSEGPGQERKKNQ